MKNQTDGKKKGKVVKKLKKIRSIVMMLMVCVMLLSAATYAWFSLSNLARVSNLTMTVSEADGLRVALNKGTDDNPTTPAESEWSGSISLAETVVNGVLKPATTANGLIFQRPQYSDEGVVTGFITGDSVNMLDKTNTANLANAAEGYYCRYTFWMEALKEDAVVHLSRGANLDQDSRTGTYIVRNAAKRAEKTAAQQAKSAVDATLATRVSIIAGTMGATAPTTSENDYHAYKIYEPFAAAHTLGATSVSQASVSPTLASVYPATADYIMKQNADGTFAGGTTAGGSQGLFKLKADTPTLITLYIWIEGSDEDCINQIELDDLIMQLQFDKGAND